MLRHACGFTLAKAGHNTRRLQDYLGHKSINSTVRYTELDSSKFDDFWKWASRMTDEVHDLQRRWRVLDHLGDEMGEDSRGRWAHAVDHQNRENANG
jgi:hypothetical protein